MARRLGTALMVMGILLGLAAAPVSAAPPDEWHRLNPFTDSGLLEHERLTCVENERVWNCVYDKLAEGDPEFTFDRTTGNFHGIDVTATWECPSWFPDFVCDNVVEVTSGVGRFRPDPFAVGQDFIVLDLEGTEVLVVYWHDQFACPWFRTFGEAQQFDPSCIFPE